eukprot:gene10655-2769_t
MDGWQVLQTAWIVENVRCCQQFSHVVCVCMLSVVEARCWAVAVVVVIAAAVDVCWWKKWGRRGKYNSSSGQLVSSSSSISGSLKLKLVGSYFQVPGRH